jgi:hypothetical protein
MDRALTLPSPTSPVAVPSPPATTPAAALRSLSDDELLRRVVDLTSRSRRVEADLVAHLAEVDARRLYARFAHPSMFAYCTEALHLSEAEAYLRIAAARASREHPVLLDMLRDGRLHLTAISLLASHLTPGNRDAVLARATHKSKRQVEELVAEVSPRPDSPSLIRRLPEPSPSRRPIHASETRAVAPELEGTSAGRLRPDGVGTPAGEPVPAPESPQLQGSQVDQGRRPGASIEPIAPARYRVQFTASAELRDKLERLRALMRHAVPDGNLALLIDAAVSEKLEKLEARRFGRRTGPHAEAESRGTPPRSRHVPAAVKRAVFERDGGRCRYTDENGKRCSAREGLEIHHRHPFSHGGGHSAGDLGLLCRSHNQRLAEHDFGRAVMDRHRARDESLSRCPSGARQGAS